MKVKLMREFLQSIVLAAFSLLVLAVSVAAFDGKYIPYGPEGDAWDCGEVGVASGAFQINVNRLTGLEYDCTLSNPTQIEGLNASVFEGDCAAEGGSYSLQTMLMPWQF